MPALGVAFTSRLCRPSSSTRASSTGSLARRLVAAFVVDACSLIRLGCMFRRMLSRASPPQSCSRHVGPYVPAGPTQHFAQCCGRKRPARQWTDMSLVFVASLFLFFSCYFSFVRCRWPEETCSPAPWRTIRGVSVGYGLGRDRCEGAPPTLSTVGTQDVESALITRRRRWSRPACWPADVGGTGVDRRRELATVVEGPTADPAHAYTDRERE